MCLRVFLTFTRVSIGDGPWLPWLLMVTWAAFVTAFSTSIVLTYTMKLLYSHTHTHTHIFHLVKHFTYVPIYRCSGVCRYLANRVKWAALSMSIADTHPTHRDVFDGIIILRNTVTQKVSESTSQFIGQRSTFCSLSHPPSDNRVNISRIASTQGHQVGIQCSDSLKSQSDVTRRRKIQQI